MGLLKVREEKKKEYLWNKFLNLCFVAGNYCYIYPCVWYKYYWYSGSDANLYSQGMGATAYYSYNVEVNMKKKKKRKKLSCLISSWFWCSSHLSLRRNTLAFIIAHARCHVSSVKLKSSRGNSRHLITCLHYFHC